MLYHATLLKNQQDVWSAYLIESICALAISLKPLLNFKQMRLALCSLRFALIT